MYYPTQRYINLDNCTFPRTICAYELTRTLCHAPQGIYEIVRTEYYQKRKEYADYATYSLLLSGRDGSPWGSPLGVILPT